MSRDLMLEHGPLLESRLTMDRDVVMDIRGGDTPRVDTNQPVQDLIQSIREEASRIGMGSADSAAYHARKHYKELPEAEQSLPPSHRDITSKFSPRAVQDYFDSMERTIREGEISQDPLVSDDGSRRMVFERFIDSNGERIFNSKNEPSSVKARLLVTADGRVLVPTFGKM